MPEAADELALIELFGRTRVIGLAINHENMGPSETAASAALYEFELGIPAADPLWDGANRLVDMVLRAYPSLAPEGEKVAT